MDSEGFMEVQYGAGDESDVITTVDENGVTKFRVDDHVPVQDDWGVVTTDGTYYGPGTSKEVGRAVRKLSEAGAPYSAGQTKVLEESNHIVRRAPLTEL